MDNRAIIERVLKNDTDDIDFSNKYIFSVLLSNRSTLLVNKLKKNQVLTTTSYQHLPCVELITADISECPIVKNTGAYVLKSKYPIPELLSDMDVDLMIVTSLDGTIRYTLSKYTTRNYREKSKYVSKIPTFYLMPNRHIYCSNSLAQDAVACFGLFKNPLQAFTFPMYCSDVDNCKSYLDFDFPIDGDLESTVIELSQEEILAKIKKVGTDVHNNSKDDTQQG